MGTLFIYKKYNKKQYYILSPLNTFVVFIVIENTKNWMREREDIEKGATEKE